MTNFDNNSVQRFESAQGDLKQTLHHIYDPMDILSDGASMWVTSIDGSSHSLVVKISPVQQ